MLISGNTVHQLSHEDFNTLRDNAKGATKKKLTGQRSFEFLVIGRGDGFDFGYTYTTALNKVDMVCGKANHKFSITPNSYKSGHGCPKCAGCCPEQAKDDFISAAKDRGDTVVGEYIAGSKKVAMICGKVGHGFNISPRDYKSGRGCNKCSGHCPVQSRDGFINMTKDRGDTVVGEYTEVRNKVAMICGKAGHKFSIRPSSYKRGEGCPKCSGQCPEQAHDKFIAAAKDRGDTVVGGYINSNKKVEMVCGKAGHKFAITPTDYKGGHGCVGCSDGGGFKPNKVGYVYIMRSVDFKNDVIKIGISDDPERRMQELKKATPFEFNMIEIFQFDYGRNARNTEHASHKIKPKYEFDSF